MSQPGWYPDPDGTPRRERWWDGHQWTGRTRDAADSVAPPTSSEASGRPRPRSIAVVVVTVVLVVAAAALGPALRSAIDSARSASSARGTTGRSTDAAEGIRPSVAASGAAPAKISVRPDPESSAHPCDGTADSARLADAGLAVDLPADGWRARGERAPWMHCGQTMAGPGGLVVVSLGAGPAETDDPQTVARTVWEAVLADTGASSDDDPDSGAAVVAGVPGWCMHGVVGEGYDAEYVYVAVADIPGETAGRPSVIVGRSVASEPEALMTLEQVLASAHRS
ncbi:MAG: DUF2510 domain-containing protein [Propioniciclava sp.]|uniref:DUF2510 domain-containing protein n=1 Tax=Propioniciclava sp. TaxID=2038686 RepID=UPI0039E4EBF1